MIPEDAESVNQKGNEESYGERQPTTGSAEVLIGAQEATSHEQGNQQIADPFPPPSARNHTSLSVRFGTHTAPSACSLTI